MLRDKINNKEAGIVFYGMTPPKENTSTDRVKEIAAKHVDRIKRLNIDGVVLYDIQDESSRTEEERPFPFLPTFEPQKYSNDYLTGLDLPKVLFQCVGKHTESSLKNWMGNTTNKGDLAVFVGNSSSAQKTEVDMDKAYNLRKENHPNMLVGGIAIPERHFKKKDEHIRMHNKIAKGVSYFTTQAVYSVEASKNLLSDYYYYAKEHNLKMVPIMFTFSPCGSVKTMEFMKWLGIHVPKWLKNDLNNTDDILHTSVETCLRTFKELLKFAIDKGIPIGCNIESVSIRRDEIEASIELLEEVKKLIDQHINTAVSV